MSDPDNAKSSHNFGSYLRGFGAFAFLITIFMAGFGIASTSWSSSNSTLQIDLRHSQEELSKSTQELAQVKSEYAVFRQKSTSGENNVQTKVLTPQKASEPTAPGEQATGQTSEILNIGTEKTGYAFNGAISVSLAATPFEGDPLRHKVLATVSSAGSPSFTIDRKDVGFVTTYKAKETYEILVAAADTFSAQFRVTRGPK